jgi:hypothetical protein
MAHLVHDFLEARYRLSLLLELRVYDVFRPLVAVTTLIIEAVKQVLEAPIKWMKIVRLVGAGGSIISWRSLLAWVNFSALVNLPEAED